MKKIILLSLLMLHICCGFSQVSKKTTCLTHVEIVDVINGIKSPNMTVIITDSLITEIGASEKIKIPRKSKVINCKGKFLIPGLWDMHVHLGNATGSSLPLFIANGITGLRDMGTKNFDAIQNWKEMIRSGSIDGPRIISSGPILNGGKNLPDFQIAVNSIEEARGKVDSLVKIGVDFIKVHAGLSKEVYYAIAEQSKKHHISFVGHIPASNMSVAVSGEEASEVGQRSLEHMLGIPFTRDTIKAYQHMYPTPEGLNKLLTTLKRNDTYITPTLTIYSIPADYLSISSKQKSQLKYISPELQSFWESQIGDWPRRDKTFMSWLLKTRMRMIPVLRDAGIPMLAGTDTGFPFVLPGFGLNQELSLLVESGLTPLEAIKTATINPAIFMEKQDKLGSVTIGKLADLVLLKADPTVNIQNLKFIDAVFKNGKLYNNTKLKALLKHTENKLRN